MDYLDRELLKQYIGEDITITFLDIDGTLLNMNDYEANNYHDDKYGVLISETPIRNLQRIIDETETKIIITSTNGVTARQPDFKRMQDMWKFRNYPGEVIGVLPANPFLEIGEGPWFRGAGIELVLEKDFNFTHQDNLYNGERHKRIRISDDSLIKVKNYCIVDDDKDMTYSQRDHFVQTDEYLGITFEDSLKIIEILKRELEFTTKIF